MMLRDLLEALPGAEVRGEVATPVLAITHDSRRAVRGSLFVAIRGYRQDGHDYVLDALRRGSRVIVGEQPIDPRPGTSVVTVPDSRVALAELAARFYGYPSRRLRLIGVTGTNGKTTTTHLIRAILRKAGHRVGLVGTIENLVDDEPRPAERTTPEPPELQGLLAEMVGRGCTHAVMEVSSHALELERVRRCEFDLGIFTNLTQDHLDFHGSLSTYLEAKARLFSSLGRAARGDPKPGPKVAILNDDDPASDLIEQRTAVPVSRYGLKGSAPVRAENLVVGAGGTAFTLVTPAGTARIELKLRARFNVYNALAAAAAGLAQGVTVPVIADALEEISGVTGRMEVVHAGQDFTVLVDYAHTPDGLENILQTARELAEGRVVLVFGCGGDRDRGKRPLMGRLAARYADYTVITSDNPRSEDPASIIREVEAGVRAEGLSRRGYETIVDREHAIARAIDLAGPGDMVLIAGKGHETYQIFRDRVIEFDDREVARRKLRERLRSVRRLPPVRGIVL